MKLTIELPQWIIDDIFDTERYQEERIAMYKALIEEFLHYTYELKEDADFSDFLDHYQDEFSVRYDSEEGDFG